MALGVTFVVISGNLDLSVGSMMSFSTIVVLDLHDKIGPALAIPAMFAMTLCARGLHRVSGGVSEAEFVDRHLGHAVGHSWPDADLFGRQEHGYRRQGRHLVRRLRAGHGPGDTGADSDFRAAAAVWGSYWPKRPLAASLCCGWQWHGGDLFGHPPPALVFCAICCPPLAWRSPGFCRPAAPWVSQNTVGQGMELDVLRPLFWAARRCWADPARSSRQ